MVSQEMTLLGKNICMHFACTLNFKMIKNTAIRNCKIVDKCERGNKIALLQHNCDSRHTCCWVQYCNFIAP